MKRSSDENGRRLLSRRDFLLASAAAGAAVPLADAFLINAAVAPVQPQANPGDLNVAIIGVGEQGRVLIDSCLHLPGIRFKAVCDIWEYSRRYGSRYLKKYGHVVNVYEDYRELLEKENDLDAVIVATPDWMHAEHANACMRAGLHVYCEKEMSNSLEEARSIVETACETSRLCQIGHQRRSNPRYQHAIDKLIHEVGLLGRVNHGYAQWNKSKTEDLGWPKKYEIDAATLKKYGYDSMHEFRNWRWYKKYGGGPIVDLGSHQIDIFNWAFAANPTSVIASGGKDFYKQHEWYDNVMAIFTYETAAGTARAFYQVLTTTRHGQFFETFMGLNGSLDISELPRRGNTAWRESHAPEWNEWIEKGYLIGNVDETLVVAGETAGEEEVFVDVRATREAQQYLLPVELAKPAHQPHLENFFDAIREEVPLTCPPEVGYETAVAVLKVNEAVQAGKLLEYKPEEFLLSENR